MIDQTIPLQLLTEGLARCLRDKVLPFVNDTTAVIQAEQIIHLLGTLPAMFDSQVLEKIKTDSDDARALLRALKVPCKVAEAAKVWDVDDLMRENGELKRQLEQLADRYRLVGDAAADGKLSAIQRYFVSSARAEEKMASSIQDFESLTARDQL